ncbi:MAG TPA: hypothetical protein VLT90_08515 [Terriglobales bacterium]|nr:hypothetical protein [Terriglobales bacterium]
MKSGGSLSIWFFVGLSLGVSGFFILVEGLYELAHPPQVHVALYYLHANIWWGALLTVLGAFYCIHFRPGKPSS